MPMLDDWMTFVCDGCRELYSGTPEFTERDMTFCCETCWDSTKYAKSAGSESVSEYVASVAFVLGVGILLGSVMR